MNLAVDLSLVGLHSRIERASRGESFIDSLIELLETVVEAAIEPWRARRNAGQRRRSSS
jgi:hypothetical protein